MDPDKSFADVEPLDVVTFGDLCKKENKTTDAQEIVWEEKCLTEPKYCGIEPGVSRACWKTMSLLDFIYDRKQN